MFCVTVLYPKTTGATFDHDYYKNVHLPLVSEKLKPFGLRRMEVIRGIAAMAGAPAPFFTISNYYFDEADQFFDGMAAVGTAIIEDIPQYTTIDPLIQLGGLLATDLTPEPPPLPKPVE